MDEKKETRKQESIDEILSDLNGLLNKMPALLEGIKLPEITPIDLSDALKLDATPFTLESAPGWSSPLANDSSAPGPARVPELENFSLKEDAFDKTVRLDESWLPGAAASGEKDKLVLQSLGESMFAELSSASGGLHPSDAPGPEGSGPGARSPSFSVEPAGLDSAPELPEWRPPTLPPIKPIADKLRTGPADKGIDDLPGIYSPPSQVNMDEIPVMEPETLD